MNECENCKRERERYRIALKQIKEVYAKEKTNWRLLSERNHLQDQLSNAQFVIDQLLEKNSWLTEIIERSYVQEDQYPRDDTGPSTP